jgi:hypothetical protein
LDTKKYQAPPPMSNTTKTPARSLFNQLDMVLAPFCEL